MDGTGDAAIAFAAVSSIFARKTINDGPLEIESLPRAMCDSEHGILRDQQCVGIPKALLIKAFIAARSMIWPNPDSMTSLPDCVQSENALTQPQIHLEATPILLLFDPEHLTAANLRKQRLLKIADCGDAATLQTALSYELWLCDSFHTSPLNKHTKSPTLWNHRRWLHFRFWDEIVVLHMQEKRLMVQRDDGKQEEETPLGVVLRHELATVAKAGERHPRNYYAWDYGRILTRLVSRRCTDAMRVGLLRVSVDTVHEWCLRHPSDVSGWSFLMFLLWQASDTEMTFRVVEITVDFAVRFQCSGEAIWGFVRGATAAKGFMTAGQRLVMLSELRPLCVSFESDGVAEDDAVSLEQSSSLSDELMHMEIGKAIKWIDDRRQS